MYSYKMALHETKLHIINKEDFWMKFKENGWWNAEKQWNSEMAQKLKIILFKMIRLKCVSACPGVDC